MESRAFIKMAAVLIDEIENAQNFMGTAVELQEHRESIQREVSTMFNGLQNPTLPSAFRLRNSALRNGYTISPKILNDLSRFD